MAKRAGFSLPASRSRTVALGLIGCILLNFLVPRSSIADKEYEGFYRILAAQSVIFEYFSFYKLPARMADAVCAKVASRPSRHAKVPPRAPVPRSADSSSDFSLTNLCDLRPMLRYGMAQTGELPGGGQVSVFMTAPRVFDPLRDFPDQPLIPISAALCLLFFLLPRRGVYPDLRSMSHKAFLPNSHRRIGFFIFRGSGGALS